MNNLIPFELFENVQSQNDIEYLARVIKDTIVKGSIEWMLDDRKFNSSKDAPTFSMINDIMPMNLKAEKTVRWKLSSQLKQYIKETPLKIIYLTKMGNIKAHGSFQIREDLIRIYIDIEEIEKFKKELIDIHPNGNHTNLKRLYDHLLSTRHDVLVHELRHAFDSWKSKRKAFNLDKIVAAESEMEVNRNYDDYYKLPHEINARYSQVVSTINDKGIKIHGFDAEFNWENYLNCFTQLFLGWDLMAEDQKKRLTSRLYLQFKHKVGSKTPSINIKDNIEKFVTKWREQDVDIIIHYKHSDDVIQIYTLKCVDESQQEVVMCEIVKIAETYRKTITLTPYKNHNGLNIGTYVALLKELGFKGNTGRYGGKRDYRFMDSFLRYPKREYKTI